MARIRTEDQIFFIFNHQALICEEDDLKDAIMYFFPTSISIDGQCALVGQLMGLVDFFKSFSASPPLIYKLEKNKVAVKHLGKYTMALSGNRMEPDCVVITQLNYLYNIFTFYFGSLQQLDEEYKGNAAGLSSVMHDIWDCYLPFVRRYGDSVAAGFDSLPVVDLSEPQSLAFLKASHLLQDCRTKKNIIAGCILYKNRVLCSQLCPDITSHLLVIPSQESQFPCKSVRTDDTLSEVVKLINVFVKEDDYRLMKHMLTEKVTSGSPFTFLPDNSKYRSPPSKEFRNDASPDQHTKSMDWNHETKLLEQRFEENCENTDIYKTISLGKQELDICKRITSETTNGQTESYHSTVKKSLSQPNISEKGNVVKKHPPPVSSVPSYGRQRSCEFRSSNVVGIEHVGTESDDYRKEWEVVGSHLSPGEKKHLSDAAAVWHPRKHNETENIHSMSPSKESAESVCHDDVSLLMNIKRNQAQTEEAMNEQTDLNNDTLNRKSGKDLESLDNTSVKSSHPKQFSSAFLDSNINVHYSEEQQTGYRTRDVTDDTDERALSGMLSDMLKTNKSSSISPKQRYMEKDLEASFPEESNLITLNLYIQGVADTVLLLFTEYSAITDNIMIHDMVEMIRPHLVDLDSHLSKLSAHNNVKEEMPLSYNYLTYNSCTKNLSGQISMSHGILQPLSHEELDFCGTAIAMHDEFKKSPGLVDVTMRNQTSCIYGHKGASQEVYFQPKHCRPPRGISPARDTVMCLSDLAHQSLLVDRGINIS